MSKTCKNCGNTFEDHMNICPRCGMQYVADAPQYTTAQPINGAVNQPQNPNQYVQPNYGQQNYQQQGYGQPTYQQPAYQAYPAANEQMTVGNWVATIIVTNLGIIGIILLFVWAFSSNVPLAKKNYCRAMLIIDAIVLALIILLMILGVLSASSFINGLGNYSTGYYA